MSFASSRVPLIYFRSILVESIKYEPRLYREAMGNDRWVSFSVSVQETDLWIAVSNIGGIHSVKNFSLNRILFYRNILETHILAFPEFLSSLTPLVTPEGVHPLLREMYEASHLASTGPMSAVAGAVAEYICRDLINEYGFPEVIVENGGDIFMRLTSPATISVYAGESPLSGKIGLVIAPGQTPLAVCCSSGTVGHSFSFGNADACMIASESGAVADAYATAFCNKIKNRRMVGKVADEALKVRDILSVIIIKDNKVGLGGKIEVSMKS